MRLDVLVLILFYLLIDHFHLLSSTGWHCSSALGREEVLSSILKGGAPVFVCQKMSAMCIGCNECQLYATFYWPCGEREGGWAWGGGINLPEVDKNQEGPLHKLLMVLSVVPRKKLVHSYHTAC